MKLHEEFVVAESAETLWHFLEQFDRVARCVPGVETVTVVDADNSQVRITQALGPMTATFDVKMRVTARDPGRSMEFTAVGRSVKGAAGNVRATQVVRLEESDEGSTRVQLDGDLALGGMLGSVAQKVVAKQAAAVTQSFAQALARELSGGSPAADPAEADQAVPIADGSSETAVASAPENPAAPDPAAPPQPSPPSDSPPKLPRIILGGAIAIALLLTIRRLRAL